MSVFFHLTSIVVRVYLYKLHIINILPTSILSPEGNAQLKLGILMARESLAPRGRLLR